MRSRMMGVALAAAVSACALIGGVQRAEAATISFSGYGPASYSDVFLEFQYSFDARMGSASVGDHTVSPTFTGDSNFTITDFHSVVNYEQAGVYHFVFDGFALGTFAGKSIKGSINVNAFTLGSVAPGSAFQEVPVSVEDSITGAYFSGSLSGNFISAVPLPNTATLLGIAIFTLSSANYVFRRSLA